MLLRQDNVSVHLYEVILPFSVENIISIYTATCFEVLYVYTLHVTFGL